MLKAMEIDFLCIHKDLRSRRLTPALFKEITRRCYLEGIYQSIYTAGVVLPKPISSCRYYHRILDWQKLYEVGFLSLPVSSTAEEEIKKTHLPSDTATPNLRTMQEKDVEPVLYLLGRYLNRFDLAPVLTGEEIEHWLLHKEKPVVEQVLWSYVVEEPETHKITDFISFYSLDTLVLDNAKHSVIHTAYLYYYASEVAFKENEEGLRERLMLLVNDALILAKRVRMSPPSLFLNRNQQFNK
jgi:glycylpeptide N-tetradecanoyltransferase